MLAALAGVPATLWAQAADCPKPGATLRFIVPFPPGGLTDGMARRVGQQLGERPAIEERAGTQGFRIDGRGPQAFALFLKTETERRAKLIVAAKITAA